MNSLAPHFSYWVTLFLMIAGLYILIARGTLMKKLIGLAILQSSVYLLYIAPGKLIGGTAPIVAASSRASAGALTSLRSDCQACPETRQTCLTAIALCPLPFALLFTVSSPT